MTSTSTDIEHAGRLLVAKLSTKFPEYAAIVGKVRLEISNRLTSSAAKAVFCPRTHRPLAVRVSFPIFKHTHNLTKGFDGVVLHEFAHCIAGLDAAHGPKWKRICQQIGGITSLYHTLEATGLDQASASVTDTKQQHSSGSDESDIEEEEESDTDTRQRMRNRSKSPSTTQRNKRSLSSSSSSSSSAPSDTAKRLALFEQMKAKRTAATKASSTTQQVTDRKEVSSSSSSKPLKPLKPSTKESKTTASTPPSVSSVSSRDRTPTLTGRQTLLASMRTARQQPSSSSSSSSSSTGTTKKTASKPSSRSGTARQQHRSAKGHSNQNDDKNDDSDDESYVDDVGGWRGGRDLRSSAASLISQLIQF